MGSPVVADGSPDCAADLASSRAPSRMSKMGLHQIARLHRMLLRWRRRAASNVEQKRLQTAPARSRKLAKTSSACGGLSVPWPSSSSPPPSSSSSSSSSSAASAGGGRDGGVPPLQELPPAGYLAIYVGRERRRFEIPTEHINHPLLRGLLQRTEEEFGLNPQGALAIPACEVVMFEHLLWMVRGRAAVRGPRRAARAARSLHASQRKRDDMPAGSKPRGGGCASAGACSFLRLWQAALIGPHPQGAKLFCFLLSAFQGYTHFS